LSKGGFQAFTFHIAFLRFAELPNLSSCTMKSAALTLVGLICCFSFCFSQNYFYDENRLIQTNPDLEFKVLHFEDSEYYLSFLRNVPENLKIEKRIEKYNAVVISIPGNENATLNIGNEHHVNGIKDESFGLELQDGFNLYLSYELLFEPKYGVNIENTSIVNEVISEGGKLYRDEYGSFHLKLTNPKQSLEVSNDLVEANLVNWAHPNFYSNHTKYTDPLYSQQFQMNNTGQTISGVSGLNDVDCDAPEAWGITTGSDQITVAVIDDGVEAHPDLEDSNGNSRLESGNTPANGGDGSPILSNDGHGTACAGIIAASHNSIHVKGIAPNVKLLSVNIFQGSETISDIANAFNYARINGADVISNSWGYTSCTLSLSAINSAISNAKNNGRGGLGCVIAFASGNGYKSCVDYPADLSYVLAVGAVTSLGTHSNYSNTGPALDIVAPSNSAPGQSGPGVRTIDRVGFAGYSSGSSTSSFGGTSAACPVVAGCAALLLSHDSGLTESDVRTLLEDHATDMGSSGYDFTYGHGRVSAYDALLTLNPDPQPIDCSSLINQFPYQEGFESGLGSWAQGDVDDFNWAVNSGGTPSSGTGPASASEGNQYIYTESSSPNYPSKTAFLNSPCFDLSAVSNPEMAFDYNMNGSAMGVLVVQGSPDGITWTDLYTVSGDQGSSWNTQVLSLADYSSESSFTIRFNVTTANSYTSDVAVDNFQIGVAGSVGISNPCSEGFLSAFPLTNGFEADLGNWEQSNQDDVNWTLSSGGTPSNGTGPSGAFEGSQYLYLETSSPNFPSKSATIQLSCLDISNLDNPTFYMSYHMLGNAIGSLVVEAQETGSSWIELLSLSGSQGSLWNSTSISLDEFAGVDNLQIRIKATSGSSWSGDIAIDALSIGEDAGMEGPDCASSESLPFADGFENGEGNWLQDTNDQLDWDINSGGTPSGQTGPSSASEGSNYFYIEASSPNYPAKTARITSPCIDLSQVSESMVMFNVHMYGSRMGELSLEARSEEDGNWSTLWSQAGEIGNFWQTVEIPLEAYYGSSGVQFRFTGITGTGYRSDIAIDDFQVISSSGAGGTAACPVLDFSGQVQSYGISQDNGSYGIFLSGDRVDLYDNAWKAHPTNYSITPNTVIGFEFRSTSQGEIQGIGFDNDDNISTNYSFQLTGTQNWGIQNFNNYSGSSWESYSIPVGSFFTGSFDRITLINDNDAGTGNDARFRNVKVYESGDCDPSIQLFNDVTEIVIAGEESDELAAIKVYPNPAKTSVRISMPGIQSESTQVRFMDITGKTIRTQPMVNSSCEFDISSFAPGIYIVNVEMGQRIITTERLIVTR